MSDASHLRSAERCSPSHRHACLSHLDLECGRSSINGEFRFLCRGSAPGRLTGLLGVLCCAVLSKESRLAEGDFCDFSGHARRKNWINCRVLSVTAAVSSPCSCLLLVLFARLNASESARDARLKPRNFGRERIHHAEMWRRGVVRELSRRRNYFSSSLAL